MDKIAAGQREHKSGVHFDPNYEGYDVQGWKHVFSQQDVDVYLQGREGHPPTRLRVLDRPITPGLGSKGPPAWVVKDARTMKNSGFDNRKGDPSKGEMSSGGASMNPTSHPHPTHHPPALTKYNPSTTLTLGAKLARDGFQKTYSLRVEADTHELELAKERMGDLFHEVFVGEGVVYEEMLEEQQRLWPASVEGRPHHWDFSRNLGNAEHVDPDGWRSYAVWVSDQPTGASASWFLLFPHHSLAIALGHGTWVSWDGRVQPHCTAVPQVAAGDELLSVFCSLPARLIKVAERALAGDDQLKERHVSHIGVSSCGAQGELASLYRLVGKGSGRAYFDTMFVGRQVLYRIALPYPSKKSGKEKEPPLAELKRWGKNNHRFVEATVVEVEPGAGKMTVRDGWGGSNSGKAISEFSVGEVFNRVTLPRT